MRTLKRPMFKKGGSANEGIMHGLVDRRKYANSNAADLFQSLSGSPDTYPYGISFKDANVTEPIMGGDSRGFDWPRNLLKSMDPQEQNIQALTEKIAELPYVSGAKPNIPGTPIVADPQPKVKKTTGDIDGIDRNQLQQIIADKKEGLSDKAKKYAEILSPNAMKRATTDALIAASEAGQTSTGNTFQDLTNMLTAAAKGSGGARDTLDKANLLALQEEIQTNIAKATYKPNTIETTIALGRSSNKEDQKMFKALTKGSNVDSAMIIELAKIETGDNKIQKATGKMYEVKANAANAEQYGGDLPITFNTKTKTDEESFDKMEKGKEYFNYLDCNFYALDENGQPALINKPDYLK